MKRILSVFLAMFLIAGLAIPVLAADDNGAYYDANGEAVEDGYNGEENGYEDTNSDEDDTNGEEANGDEEENGDADYADYDATGGIFVNGEQKELDSHSIGGYNFFRIRDLAYILSGTEKQFNVEWDAENNAIILTSGEEYVVVGGEMEIKDIGDAVPRPRFSTLYIDGEAVEFEAYFIAGNNYFRLRDVMEAFDVFVGYDEDTSTITIDTSRAYGEYEVIDENGEEYYANGEENGDVDDNGENGDAYGENGDAEEENGDDEGENSVE